MTTAAAMKTSIWPRYSSSATAPVNSSSGNAQRPDEPDERRGDRGGPERREDRPGQRRERADGLGERRRVEVGADHVRVRLRVAHARPRGPVRVHVEDPRRPWEDVEQPEGHEHHGHDDEQVEPEPLADARLDRLRQARQQPVDRCRDGAHGPCQSNGQRSLTHSTPPVRGRLHAAAGHYRVGEGSKTGEGEISGSRRRRPVPNAQRPSASHDTRAKPNEPITAAGRYRARPRCARRSAPRRHGARCRPGRSGWPAIDLGLPAAGERVGEHEAGAGLVRALGPRPWSGASTCAIVASPLGRVVALGGTWMLVAATTGTARSRAGPPGGRTRGPELRAARVPSASTRPFRSARRRPGGRRTLARRHPGSSTTARRSRKSLDEKPEPGAGPSGTNSERSVGSTRPARRRTASARRGGPRSASGSLGPYA